MGISEHPITGHTRKSYKPTYDFEVFMCFDSKRNVFRYKVKCINRKDKRQKTFRWFDTYDAAVDRAQEWFDFSGVLA